ncbi:hypothetical protein FEU62_003512 [Escherichia coli]|nr:hypothetical protein [Escherichia coli]EIG4854988.1 hypothetical protein [Escherichia coli]EIG4859599.1 hypothetical protein [Escherichia coli]EIG4870362.1 hypothetical protein [Escherichia coli]
MKFSKFSELVNRILSNNHSHRRDMDVEISAELEEEEEIYRDGIRKCIAALRYHHKRAET